MQCVENCEGAVGTVGELWGEWENFGKNGEKYLSIASHHHGDTARPTLEKQWKILPKHPRMAPESAKNPTIWCQNWCQNATY